MGFLTEVSQENGDEVGIVTGGEDGQGMPDDEQPDTGQPHLQAKAEGGGQGAIDDGKGPRRAAQQKGLRQGLMQGHVKALNALVHLDQRSAAKAEEGEEEAGGGEGDRQTEDDLDQLAEAARRLAKCQGEARHDDAEDRDDLGDRPLDRVEDVLEGRFPGHTGTGGASGGGHTKGQSNHQRHIQMR